MADEFKGINQETLKNVEAIKGSMREISESTSAASKQLQQSNRLLADYRKNYSAITNSAGKFAELQDEASRSAKATGKALKEQQTQLSNIRSLNAQIDNLYDQMTKDNMAVNAQLQKQINNLSAARDNARELANAYGDLVEDSSKLDRSTMWFSALSQFVQDIPGLRTFSSPFEAASKAARETVLSNAKIKATNEIISNLGEDALKTGKGLTAEKLKQLGLEEVTQGKSHKAAATLLRTYQSSAKTQSAGIAGMQAGFKALGPMISNVFKPLFWIKLIVEGLKFMFESMVENDKQITNIAHQLNISKEAAAEVFTSLHKMKEAGKEFGHVLAGNTLLEKDYLETLIKVNSLLGMSVDLTEEQNKAFFKQLTDAQKFLKLSDDETKGLISLYAQTGEEIENIKLQILGATKEQKLLTGYQIDERKVLKDVLTTSNALKLSIKGGKDALIQATIEANKFGISLENIEKTAEGLLDFENSIANELEAELFLNRDINLERARAASLTNDTQTLMEEIGKQVKAFGPDFQKNVFAQQSFAKTLGLSVKEVGDMYTKYQELEQLQSSQQKLSEKDLKILKEKGKLSNDQLNLLRAGNMAAGDYLSLLKSAGFEGEDLQRILGELSVSALEATDATQKWDEMLANVKESFSKAFTGEMIDNFATLLADFVKTWQEEGFFSALFSTGGNRRSSVKEKEEMTPEKRKEVENKEIVQDVNNRNFAYKDFIMRPGQPIRSFDKDDIVIGGTNLLGEKNSSSSSSSSSSYSTIIDRLDKLIYAVEQKQSINFNLDSYYAANKRRSVKIQ